MPTQAHHYLSQAFLDGFTDSDGSVWMFDRTTNRFCATGPRAIAAENDLYAFIGADGSTHRDIETDLARLVDGPIRPILKRIAARLIVTDKELADLSLFVGFLRVRTPSGIDEIDQALRGVANKTNPFLSREHVTERLRKYEQTTGSVMPLTADEIVEMFSSGRYEIVPERGHLLVGMCEMGLTLAMQLRSLDWTFLFAARDRHFVVSDCPVVVVPPLGHDIAHKGIGILSKGAVKYVPLTQGLCLRMGDFGAQVGYSFASGNDVRRINCWIARNSTRFVFGSSEVLLRRVIDVAKLEPGERKAEVVIRDIPHATDPSRSILQVFSRAKIEPERSSE